MQLQGLSYASTGSIAYPRRTRMITKPRHELLQLVLENIHPANLGELPPSPELVALKGEQIGLGRYREFFVDIWF